MMTRCTNCKYRWKSKEKHWLYELKDGCPCTDCGTIQYVKVEDHTFRDMLFWETWLDCLWEMKDHLFMKLSSENEEAQLKKR